MLAASSVLAASYLGFSYTPPPGTRRNGLVCPLASLNALKWVVFLTPCNAGFVIKVHVFPASVDRWPHVVAYCSDSLSLVCWLVEHSCAAPLPSTQAHTHTPLHKHTGIHKPTHTHYTLECRWSNIGVEFDIATVGQTGRAGDTGVRVGQHQPPAPSNQRDGVGGKCRAEKNKSHWGLPGCGGRLRVAKVSRADS